MPRCSGCNDQIPGKGYRASGLCRGCYDATRINVGDLVTERSTGGHDPVGTAGPSYGEPTGRGVGLDRPRTPLVPGGPCPLCGKPVGLTNAERQRRYRARKRGE